MPDQTSRTRFSPEPLTATKRAGLAAAAVAFLVPWVVHFPGLSAEGHRVFAVFLMAIALWITEAVPLHATAALIIVLQILLISDQSPLPAAPGFAPPPYEGFFHALAHPVLMLFLGGFFLADGASKFGLDRNLARVLLRPFGRAPRRILLGLMLITALFSMFMSNTATTATMMAVVLPLLGRLPPGDRMRTGLALAVPVAANIGGIGTPIGTPPNAIALGALADAGIRISFAQWMVMAVPLMLCLLLAAWLLLGWRFAGGQEEVRLDIDARFDTSRSAIVFYATFAVTVALWLSESLHGLSSNVVGFVPVAVLLSTRVFSTKDFRAIQWHVLWLVAGGIALGDGVNASGLDEWLIGRVAWERMGPGMLSAMLCLAALLTSTFISHSATANLLVPIGMSLALSDAVAISPVLAGVFIAIGCSLAMALPISTPPNAIAYSTGAVRTREMALVGAAVGAAGWGLFVFVAPALWKLLGVMP